MTDYLESYCCLRDMFKTLLQDSSLSCEISYKEDKDNLALHFSIKNEDTVVDYYYCYNDFAIHRFINEKNEALISRNPDYFTKIIERNINEIINKAEVI